MFLIFLEKEETSQQKMERKTPGKRERKASDDLEEYDEEDDDEDEDYKISANDGMGAEWKYLSDDCKRSYTTRRNAKIPDSKISFPKQKNLLYLCWVALLYLSCCLIHFLIFSVLLAHKKNFRITSRHLLKSQRSRMR